MSEECDAAVNGLFGWEIPSPLPFFNTKVMAIAEAAGVSEESDAAVIGLIGWETLSPSFLQYEGDGDSKGCRGVGGMRRGSEWPLGEEAIERVSASAVY